MAPVRRVLFVRGGGAGAHDERDCKLAGSLRREPGGGYEVRCPRMPGEGDPGYARWSAAIRREMAGLGHGAAVAGHSAGAAVLAGTLAGQPPGRGLAVIALTAAPFAGPGGWPGGGFELASDPGTRLPPGARVHVLHGLRDETAPPPHAGRYALAIPRAQARRLPGRDHQLNSDPGAAAEAVSISRPGPAAGTRAPARPCRIRPAGRTCSVSGTLPPGFLLIAGSPYRAFSAPLIRRSS